MKIKEIVMCPAPFFLKKIIRVKKEDSAYVYFILESHEGIASYSTLEFKTGDAFRDLELRFSQDFINEVNEIMQELGDMVYEIQSE